MHKNAIKLNLSIKKMMCYFFSKLKFENRGFRAK